MIKNTKKDMKKRRVPASCVLREAMTLNAMFLENTLVYLNNLN
jgi:hypothetical protein